jgi:hypothetical protein
MGKLGEQVERWARLDRARRQPLPRPLAMVTASVVALAGSLLVDAALVGLWTGLVPATKSYAHFRLADYATLTVIGVLVACGAWPVTCRICTEPRWLFLRLAILATAVLWIPDVVLIVRHQPVRDVVVLMVLHVAVAAVTYNALVRLAPPSNVSGGAAPAEPVDDADADAAFLGSRATLLAVAVGVTFALGVVALVVIPTGRPTGWWPEQGRIVYLVHAGLGLPLGLGAAWYLVRARDSTRLVRLSARVGAAGVAVAGAGGLLTVAHPLRLAGAALMLVGPLVAAFGYLVPTFDRLTEAPPGEG